MGIWFRSTKTLSALISDTSPVFLPSTEKSAYHLRSQPTMYISHPLPMARNNVPEDIIDLYENKAHAYRYHDDSPDVGTEVDGGEQ